MKPFGDGAVLLLGEAREHLRIGDEVSDATLGALIAAAEAAIADYLGRPLIGEGGWPDMAEVPASIGHAIKCVLFDLWNKPAEDSWPTIRALVGRYIKVGFA